MTLPAKKTDSERLTRLERDAKITRWAGVAAILGFPVAILGLLIALVGIKEIHDWLFYKVLHIYSVEQASPASSPKPAANVNSSVFPKKSASIHPPSEGAGRTPTPVFTDRDPQTAAVYERVISFDKMAYVNPNKVRGGDSKTPGREVSIDWRAPGPVTSVTGKCLVGWCEIESCNYHEDIAHCEGWTNDGNHGTINMTVHWVQPVTNK